MSEAIKVGLPSSHTRRRLLRKLKSNLMVAMTVLATVAALVPLFVVLGYLAGC